MTFHTQVSDNVKKSDTDMIYFIWKWSRFDNIRFIVIFAFHRFKIRSVIFIFGVNVAQLNQLNLISGKDEGKWGNTSYFMWNSALFFLFTRRQRAIGLSNGNSVLFVFRGFIPFSIHNLDRKMWYWDVQ